MHPAMGMCAGRRRCLGGCNAAAHVGSVEKAINVGSNTGAHSAICMLTPCIHTCPTCINMARMHAHASVLLTCSHRGACLDADARVIVGDGAQYADARGKHIDARAPAR